MSVWVFQLHLLIQHIPGVMWVNQRYFTQHNFKEMWPSLMQTSRLPVEYNSTTYEYTGRYLESCPDCLVWEDTLVNNQEGRSLYIFSELTPNFSTFPKVLFTTAVLHLYFSHVHSEGRIAGRIPCRNLQEAGVVHRPPGWNLLPWNCK